MLKNITSKLYDIINENKELELKKNISDFKELIDTYYKQQDDLNIMITDKKMYYDTYYNNPRVIQDELYNEYIAKRSELFNELEINYNIVNIKSLVKYSKFDYNTIQDIYTYDIEVNKNFRKPNTITNNTDKLKISNYVNQNERKDNTDFEIMEENEEKIEPIKNNKCTDKKIKECLDKGKVCNPDSGRCVGKLKENFKKQEDKQEEKREDKQEEKREDKQDKCTEKKIKECLDKGKVCNPDSGRCVGKLKK